MNIFYIVFLLFGSIFIWFNSVKIIELIRTKCSSLREDKKKNSKNNKKKENRTTKPKVTLYKRINLYFVGNPGVVFKKVISYFFNTPWRKVNKFIFYLFSTVICILVLINKDNILKLPIIPLLMILILVMYMFFIFPFILFISKFKKSKNSFDRFNYLYFIMNFIIVIALSVFFNSLDNIKVNNTSSNSFFTTVLFLVIIFCTSIYSLISILESTKVSMFKLFLAIATICCLVCYQYLLFGLYNMTSLNWSKMVDANDLKNIIRIMNYGTKYLSSFPEPTEIGTLIPFVQYLIARFIDVFVISFLIAYFYDYIKSKKSVETKTGQDD